MKEVHPEYENDVALYVVGASPIESLDRLESYRLEQGYSWPVAAPEGAMLRDLNVTIRSTKIAFDADGIIRYRASFGDADVDEWREVFAQLVASKS